MAKAYVYKITRVDNLEYIGITVNCKKRFSDHSRSERFSLGIKNVEILKECDSYEEAEELEEYYISLYDTFNSGLNLSLKIILI
jgi:predicted GIY-YIG superfamily endonuclease